MDGGCGGLEIGKTGRSRSVPQNRFPKEMWPGAEKPQSGCLWRSRHKSKRSGSQSGSRDPCIAPLAAGFNPKLCGSQKKRTQAVVADAQNRGFSTWRRCRAKLSRGKRRSRSDLGNSLPGSTAPPRVVFCDSPKTPFRAAKTSRIPIAPHPTKKISRSKHGSFPGNARICTLTPVWPVLTPVSLSFHR